MALPCESYEHNGMILIGFVLLYFKIITPPPGHPSENPLRILVSCCLGSNPTGLTHFLG